MDTDSGHVNKDSGDVNKQGLRAVRRARTRVDINVSGSSFLSWEQKMTLDNPLGISPLVEEEPNARMVKKLKRTEIT